MSRQTFFVVIGACIVLVGGFLGIAAIMGPADRLGIPEWASEEALTPTTPLQTPLDQPKPTEQLPQEHSPIDNVPGLPATADPNAVIPSSGP